MAGVIGGRLAAIIHHHHHHNTPLYSSPLSQPTIKLPLTIHSRRTSTMSATATTPTTALNNLTVQPTGSSSGCWSEFAGNVSGEWDGFGADFTADGKPIELPENVVPNAYREWEVQVFDWQTQCPTLAQPDNSSAMYKLIRLLPTVGCEADAATRYSVEERVIGGEDNMVSSFAYQASGCYAAVWSKQKSASSKVLELEHCLIDPRDKESRVRVIQVVGVEGNKLVLKNIKVFAEQWYGPFRNGESLGGCAIRDTAFAKTQVLIGSEVSGVWQRSNSIAKFQDSSNILQELVAVDGIEKSTRDANSLVLLPKNLWSSVVEIDGEKTCYEVGWLLEPGCAITSKCVFSRNAELKEIIASSETAA
ncbi:hypothetical protein HanRHA438_Chr16g0764731 [Helianthus annuus]|uniref:Uncharacterized protein n=1 Tax=Helianthus annuus TaxID=4232 RepID=A0A251S3T7_HELAN|nr:uncharacterized protein LOC110918064 [Helianthus annuus]KAF5760378.1 hypothetical protein HanXRQr2_Chr16g0752831 [Helianthus annuus]KAJ0438441.1 hypothetical protein HanHA300_Chr16g0614081 [Helianthus annuus]KAJ0443192.1 hypothetical protein HanIR_Chr16g0818071 [Helianthus annuus]KAJ0460765.1 hypothetical protein HanHA89_Chr16g0664661 [Helianthus annuus]KAJ0645094.1 hypothetical protein HanOQP8_Chr16g0620031 [Helianthus annuus]